MKLPDIITQLIKEGVLIQWRTQPTWFVFRGTRARIELLENGKARPKQSGRIWHSGKKTRFWQVFRMVEAELKKNENQIF